MESKTIKAFVSSTFLDLKEHRAQVIRDLRRAGIHVDPMEDWTATSDEPMEFSMERVKGCDLCVLLVGFRRGFVPEGAALSITQMEYETARQEGIEVLAFLVKEDTPWPHKYYELDKDPALRAWRSELQQRHGAEFFDYAPQSIDVLPSVTRWLQKRNIQSMEVSGKTEYKELREALRESVRDRSERQLHALITSQRPPEHPYRYLYSFDLEQRIVFFGRESAVQSLLDVIENGWLTLMHAPSGAGKTSVLRAGVQTALIERGHLPVYLPRPGNPMETIRQHLLPDPPNPGWFSQRPLSEVLALTCQQLASVQTRLVVMIDQFEEFFIQTPIAEQQDFVLNLSDCKDQSSLEQVRFIFAMRKDYLAEMEIFKNSIPQVFHNTYSLPYLTRDEARQAIERPLVNTSIHWADEAVIEVLDYLEEGVIETPQLQLICSRLYDQVKQVGGSKICLSGLDLKAVHAQYLEEEMAALKPPEFSPAQKELAWKMLKHLVTSSGTKQPRQLSELYELALPDEIDPVLNRLVIRRLLRRDDDLLNGQPIIEVSHDTLAQKILVYELPNEIRRKAAREMITRGLEDWLSYSSHPLLGLDRLKNLDEYYKDLSLPLLGEGAGAARNKQAVEFMLASAVQHGYALPYWLEIAKQSGVQVDEILVDGLRAPSFRSRATIVSTLAWLGNRFIPVLCKMLADDYPQVRMAAIAALEKLQPTGEWREFLKYECFVPSGVFILGEKGSVHDNEKPSHKVFLEDFYLGKYPVTNADYKRYCEDIQQPFDFINDKELHPVVNISWYDATNYAAWAGMRLLTEAEWEKAASWEPSIPGKKRKYPWGNEIDIAKCNIDKSGVGTTTVVGSYSPHGDSPYGCADMAGNVWEWCSSKERKYPYVAEDGREDLTLKSKRILRGGSFSNDFLRARSTCRYEYRPDHRYNNFGFRVGASIHSTLDSEIDER